MNKKLDKIDHIAIQVSNIQESVNWYQKKFKCKIIYKDETWAFIQFGNTKLALVTNTEHPPHFAILDEKIDSNPKATTHRDGSVSIYIKDIDFNFIELIKYKDK
ncbi:MAG: glyoxalase [Euryarchaeota archaeon]|nr:glyoxalase [Euryarchaeota archaeon]|tara:strand:- start:205 stop:516 length:312 start_codon:yes stop_codon:yes gene_type:complete